MVETGVVENVDFNFYVKHVLPNEWYGGWDQQALDAGAIAAKNYGWYMAEGGRQQWFGNQCYDVDDTTDYQVFDPNAPTYPSTDAAVDQTWNYSVLQNGQIMETQYRDTLTGDDNESCGAGANGWDMSQWGSEWCAQDGDTWQQILQAYYSNITITGSQEIAPPLESSDLTGSTSEGDYTIEHQNNQFYCMTLADDGSLQQPHNGQLVELQLCDHQDVNNNDIYQKWLYNPQNGEIATVKDSNYCLDAGDPVQYNNQLTVRYCNWGSNERWQPNSGQQIPLPEFSNHNWCVDIENDPDTNGDPVTVGSCSDQLMWDVGWVLKPVTQPPSQSQPMTYLQPQQTSYPHEVTGTGSCGDSACGLNQRSCARTTCGTTGHYSEGQEVGIVCQTTGDTVGPSPIYPYNSSDIWDKLTDGSYVSDLYVDTPNVNWWSPPIPHPPDTPC
jgi:hypothetical protein